MRQSATHAELVLGPSSRYKNWNMHFSWHLWRTLVRHSPSRAPQFVHTSAKQGPAHGRKRRRSPQMRSGEKEGRSLPQAQQLCYSPFSQAQQRQTFLSSSDSEILWRYLSPDAYATSLFLFTSQNRRDPGVLCCGMSF